MSLSAKVESGLRVGPDLHGSRFVPVTVFEARFPISQEHTEGPLTDIQRNILTERIRGVGMRTIAEDLSLRPQEAIAQLYGSYMKLGITTPQEEYWRETALTQAALRSVQTKELSLNTFARNFDLNTGALLPTKMWDYIVKDNGEQSSQSDLSLGLGIREDEVASMLDNSIDTLGTLTQAQTALIYLAYKRELSLTPRERTVAHVAINLFADNIFATNNDIAKNMYITLNTFKSHWKAIFAKLDINTRDELVDFYRSTPIEPLTPPVYPQPESTDGYIQIPLTLAERRVLGLILLGHSAEMAASELGVSLNTIKTHLISVYRKAGTSGKAGPERYQLLLQAYNNTATSR